MKLVDVSIKKPVTVLCGIIFTILFGLIAAYKIPIQMIPEIKEVVITVETNWRGASPEEVEREIIEEQEDVLKNIEGLVEMKSECFDGQGRITLEFQTGTTSDAALLKVSNKLNQVPEYPVDADEPVISSSGEENDSIAWMILKKTKEPFDDIDFQRTFIDDNVKPMIERIEGVAKSDLYGGRDQELHVLVDPQALAARNITLEETFRAIDSENRNISAGDLEESKRRYTVRTVGQYTKPEDVANVILKETESAPIRVKDVADVEIGYEERETIVRNTGTPTLVMNAIRQVGANILDVMKDVRKTIEEINRDVLEPRDMVLEQVYDETDYVYSALSLVRQNIWVGGGLAVAVLLLFLRSIPSTFIITLAIPISVIGVFVMMAFTGRTINVISLAGLAFAIGLVVDNAIVVLENIFRHRQMGEAPMKAAYNGVVEVWGALLASTLTTVAVFLPVIFIEEVVGQLFRDIAVAVTFAVSLSLLVSITVIPSLAARILGTPKRIRVRPDSGNAGRKNVLEALGSMVSGFFSGIFRLTANNALLKIVIILGITGLSIGMSWMLMPKTEYLPQGNRNLIISFLVTPSGYNVDEVVRMGKTLEAELSPYWGPPEQRPDDGLPGMESMFFIARSRGTFMGGTVDDPSRVRDFIPRVRQALSNIPGLIPVVQQASIFGRIAGSRTIEVEIAGPELEKLISIGRDMFDKISSDMVDVQVRPVPSLELAEPEIRIIPDRDRAASLGLTTQQIGATAAALVDGVIVSDYWNLGNRIDLVLMGKEKRARRIQDLENMELMTPMGSRVTLGDVATVELVSGPKQINHIERRRAIELQVNPSDRMPLQEAMDRINENVVRPMKEDGTIAPPYSVRLAGTADKLTQTWDVLKWNFLLALVIAYLGRAQVELPPRPRHRIPAHGIALREHANGEAFCTRSSSCSACRWPRWADFWRCSR